MSFSNIHRQSASSGLENQNIYSKENTPINTAGTARAEGNSLQELQPGKVFAGEIVSVGKEKVTLKLDNGQMIQASSNSNVQLKEGQLLAFMVKSNTGKQLAIKPMFDVNLQSSSVLKALENAGIPVSTKSAELINSLMQEHMPIDRDTVNRFLRQMNLNPEVQVKLLVDLQKMGQMVNRENIAKFQDYQNHQYPLTEDVMDLASSIGETIGTNAGREDNLGIKAFLQFADVFMPENQEQEPPLTAVQKQEPASMPSSPQALTGGWTGNVAEVSGVQNLSMVQQQELNAISGVSEHFQGQNVAMESVLEGLKILNEEATALLGELQEAIAAEMSKPEQNDMLTRLYAAFESYERSEKVIQEAKDVVASKHEVLQQDMEKQFQAEITSKDTLAGILDQNQRNALAQKVYKITGNIRQYFDVRTGNMKPEALVNLVRDHLPKDELLAEQGEGRPQNMTETFLGEKEAKVPELEGISIPGKSMGEEQKAASVNQSQNAVFIEREQAGERELFAAQSQRGQEAPNINDANKQPNANIQSGNVPPDAHVQSKNMPLNEQAVENVPPEKQWSQDGQSDKTILYKEIPGQKQADGQLGENSSLSEKTEQNGLNKNPFQQEIVQKQLENLPKVKELLHSKEFKLVMKAAIENQMLLKPEELTKERVKEYYEKMEQQLHKLTELAEQTAKQDNPILKNTNGIRQNVDYINQLNQLYSYVQLPLKLSNQNTNSELYVLTNKRRMRENNGAFTALLHLDMERLGSMDVYITMEVKKVAVRFYLDHEGIAMFLRENSQPLLEKLEEKGFLITTEFAKKPEGKNLVEEFTNGSAEEVPGSTGSFDIRM